MATANTEHPVQRVIENMARHYTVGLIYATGAGFIASCAFLDKIYKEAITQASNTNHYILGWMNKYDVIITGLPDRNTELLLPLRSSKIYAIYPRLSGLP